MLLTPNSDAEDSSHATITTTITTSDICTPPKYRKSMDFLELPKTLVKQGMMMHILYIYIKFYKNKIVVNLSVPLFPLQLKAVSGKNC